MVYAMTKAVLLSILVVVTQLAVGVTAQAQQPDGPLSLSLAGGLPGQRVLRVRAAGGQMDIRNSRG